MIQRTFDEILRSGEHIYLNSLQNSLEADFLGHYVAIDTETEAFVVNKSKLAAIESAKEKFGNKLFYIVQIGSLDTPTNNHRSKQEYAWNF